MCAPYSNCWVPITFRSNNASPPLAIIFYLIWGLSSIKKVSIMMLLKFSLQHNGLILSVCWTLNIFSVIPTFIGNSFLTSLSFPIPFIIWPISPLSFGLWWLRIISSSLKRPFVQHPSFVFPIFNNLLKLRLMPLNMRLAQFLNKEGIPLLITLIHRINTNNITIPTIRNSIAWSWP